MIRCSKCNIEKEKDKFQTYWHSTQQKHHTRRECTECYYNQRNERRRLKRKEAKLIQISIPTELAQPEVIELEPEVSGVFKKCNTCHEEKPIEAFYVQSKRTGKRFNRCAACEVEKDRLFRENERREQGGAIRVKVKPNTYTDEYQKDATFKIMKAYGWIFNEEKGMWWKPGIKNEDGTFVNVKPKIKTQKPLTDAQHEEMIRLKKKGFRPGVIAGYIGSSISSVSRWLILYEKRGERYRD
jgi:hypothetical protein